MSVVKLIAHLNELLVKFSVCVSEDQDKIPTMYGYLRFAKLQILVLVLPLNFLNY